MKLDRPWWFGQKPIFTNHLNDDELQEIYAKSQMGSTRYVIVNWTRGGKVSSVLTLSGGMALISPEDQLVD